MKKNMFRQSINAKQEGLLNSMACNKIKQSLIVAVEPFVSSEWILSIARQDKRFIPFCSLIPKDENIESKLKKYVSEGSKGLKLHPVIQNFHPESPEAYTLYDLCQSLNVPVLFHTGYIPCANSTNALIDNFGSIPRDFPQMKIILGHMNMFEPMKAIKFAMRFDNVYLETSKQPAYYIKKGIEKLGREKIIFGSDWPFGDQEISIRVIKDAVKNEATQEKIFSSNILSLLN